MPHKIVLVDGVGNGAVHQVGQRVLPALVTAAGREFIRTGEAVTELPVYRLRGATGSFPKIRHVGHYVPPAEAAA